MSELPNDVSLHGGLVDALLRDALWAGSVIFALAMAWLILGLLLPRKAPGKTGLAAVLVAAALVGLAIDVRLLAGSETALPTLLDVPANALRVEVNARQWSWSMREAGADGELGSDDDVVTTDELVVPVDTPIAVQLGAVDVIHSFSLPNLRVKADAIPGSITRTTFTATQVGVYEIACAQLCGANHYKMRGLLRVVSRADFDAWSAAQSRLARAIYDPADHDAHWAWPWH